MRKTTIISIIPTLYDGGAQKFAADLSFGFIKEFDHSFVRYNSGELEYDHAGAVIDLDVPKRQTVFGKVRRQWQLLQALKKLKQQEQTTVAISHLLMPNMLNVWSKNNDVTLCVLHGEWSVRTGRSKWLDYFVGRSYNKADHIISVSHYIKDMFDAHYKLPNPHHVIYAGIDLKSVLKKAAAPTPTTLPESYVVYVAGFRPVKNHLQLIAHLEGYLKTHQTQLVLVGDGPLREEIEQSIRDKELTSHVIVTGSLTNPYPVIAKARASLMVSSSESFSLVVVESMALGIPVIATDCGGPREILLPDWKQEVTLPCQTEYGVLIPKPDQWTKDTLPQELERLLANKERWQQLSENGKQRATYFSIERSEEAYTTLIKDITAELKSI
ncbi:glycosyltransferase [Altibacter sp.]|uniref:glycosyltransferase n=1 Tax=Altibacter sp. TaxID=2024823 RepID=UPI00258B980B|nr:glycosyltransferase [Altibacter sp.]MCW9036440.1 glycosyltransferase [Altibacter sp.]